MEPRDLEAQLELLHPLGFAWSVRCCRGDRVQAEDVLHLAYVKILEGRVKFEGRSAFKTWLFGIIRWTAYEQHRRGWVESLWLGRWWREWPDPAPDHAETIDSEKRVAQLKQALARLSKKQADVLHLVFYQDLTVHEAAEVLGMRPGTVRTHYERGKERLRVLLGAKELVR